MQPSSSSFQYQPVTIQRTNYKPPSFINNKFLDKSAPSITTNKPYPPNIPHSNTIKQFDPQFINDKINSQYLPNINTKDILIQNQSPKGIIIQKGTTLNNVNISLNNPPLKTYHSPQLNKTQDKLQRNNRGQMSRSLVFQQQQTNDNSIQQNHSLLNTQYNNKINQPIKFSPPPRRIPRMSQGYQPLENHLGQNIDNTQNSLHYSGGTSQNSAGNIQGSNISLSSYNAQTVNSYHISNFYTQNTQISKKDQQSTFMKVKKMQENFLQKKINVPAFLNKNVSQMKNASQMKKSTVQMFADQKNMSFNTNSSILNSNSNKKRKISVDDFIKLKQLGKGKYGKVYLVKEKYTEFICALKVIQKKLLKQEQITQQFTRQLKIQMYLNNPNIIKMYGYFDDQKNIYIILQTATGGQLYHHLKKNQNLPEAKAAVLMKQICQAVQYIHGQRIIHRDIKPQNIVMHQNIIKLCDFGWSVHQDNKFRTTFCGTPLYVCPQILRGKQYDEKIDIWSLGIMMYQMLVGQNPFKITKQEELIKIVKQQIKIPSYVFVSAQARDILDKTLQKNPEQRITIRQLVNHPFLKKYQEKDKKSFNL